MAIFDFFQVYSLVDVCLVVACVAAVIYLVGSIASYLLQYLAAVSILWHLNRDGHGGCLDSTDVNYC